MKVLSLFDGMSCGRIALERAGIKVDTYCASEIDRYATQISNKNYPDIIQVGDITKLKGSDYNVDLVIGGSPCQSFSIAGNQKGFEGKSGLFYEYIRILKEIKPRYFLLENVKMKKEFQDIITKELISIYPDMQLYEINSSLVSAQNRKRLYRTNIQGIKYPQNKGILLKDVLEDNVEDKYYMTINQFKNLGFESLQRLYFDKAPTLSTMQGGHRQPKVVVNKYNQRVMLEKCGTLGTGMGFTNKQGYQVIEGEHKIRKLTPLECERLQTLPDNYSEGVSNSQRYKMIGNGRTVDIISHIFKYI